MRHFSTHDLPAKSKVSFWNDVTMEVFTPMETKPFDYETFDAQVEVCNVGRLYMANVVSRPAKVHRSPTHIAKGTEQRFFLHRQTSGRLLVTQDGREALLEEGDMVLADSALPYSLVYDAPCRTLVMSATLDDLKNRFPSPDEALGVKLSGSSGLGFAVSQMIENVWSQMDESLPAELGSKIADSVLDVFAASFIASQGARVADSAAATARRVQMKRYIESHLRDPELSVRALADAFHVSPRYLHIVFSTERETISNYILRRRLEECAKQLADPHWRRRTITDIAFSWGFNNATHFARVFKDHFGLSPRDYRNSFDSTGAAARMDAAPLVRNARLRER